MNFYPRNPAMEGSPTNPPLDWNSPATETGLEESMWQLGLGREGGRDFYPERPGEPDCVYYMRTGFCGYGARCRFNHPRDRNPASGGVRYGGDYPERVGQPVCQYFLKTGTCKFGATCKYHHPRYGGGSMSPVSVNYYGYPLRPGEKECSYYVKTGQCKFGITCKFHHPQPAGTSMPAPAPAFYPTVPSPSLASPHQYGGGIPSWQITRPPLLPGSYVQGPYGPLLFPHGVVSVPGWSPYPAPMTPVASPGTQQTVVTGSSYGLTQLSPSTPSFLGPFSPLSPIAGPSSSSTKEPMFPERLGQQVCQFYMRTGDCKFGSSCRYHHPPDRNVPRTNCVLSTMGLPLRPGAPACTFYAQHGVCKFGPNCKFDHPMGSLSYSPSASSLADMPVAPYPVGSSLTTMAPSSSSSELRSEFVGGSSKESFSMSSGSLGPIFSKGGAVSHVQFSGQSSAPSSSSSSTGHGGGFPGSS